MKITPIVFQTASVVSWENKGRLSQWVRNQAEVEKTATGANFSHQELEDYITFAGETSQSKPSGVVVSKHSPSKISRKKWTREKYKQVMEAFYTEVDNPAKCCTTTSSDSRTHLQVWPWCKQACEHAIGQHQEQKARTASETLSAKLNRETLTLDQIQTKLMSDLCLKKVYGRKMSPPSARVNLQRVSQTKEKQTWNCSYFRNGRR